MDRLKIKMGRVREKINVEKRRSEKKKNQKKENIDIYYIFPIICGSGGSKMGSLMRRVRSYLTK